MLPGLWIFFKTKGIRIFKMPISDLCMFFLCGHGQTCRGYNLSRSFYRKKQK